MFIGRTAAGPYVVLCLQVTPRRHCIGAQGTAIPFRETACTYVAPTVEMQGALPECGAGFLVTVSARYASHLGSDDLRCCRGTRGRCVGGLFASSAVFVPGGLYMLRAVCLAGSVPMRRAVTVGR